MLAKAGAKIIRMEREAEETPCWPLSGLWQLNLSAEMGLKHSIQHRSKEVNIVFWSLSGSLLTKVRTSFFGEVELSTLPVSLL